MSGLIPTDFAIRGATGLTSFDVFSKDTFIGGTKGDKNLKDQLESGNVKEALTAMKRIIRMMSSGDDVLYLFPSVVKHVVSPDMEVKKLVYVYLVRYAEEEPDIALLSINSFQKDLKDPSQFIRASALRVMSSIRVDVIVPLIMLAVRQTITDMSPYVRKVTAHAIPKIFSVDPMQKDELVNLIEQLLGDRATLVLGSAINTFETVCPDRLDLIHKHFRKYCTVVVDMDEWGQIACLNLLTRYARSQFTDPNADGDNDLDEDRPFYSESEESTSDSGSDSGRDGVKAHVRRGAMDPDHRLMLNSVKPLLLSRNSAVVFAVAQLYYYLAPRAEMHVVGKAMTRLVRSHREIAHSVLHSIEAMSTKRPNMFSPYLKSFFIRNDAVTVGLMKINIMTNLASSVNISAILREFTAYIRSNKMEIVVAAIDAIARCASKLPEVTSQCISGLMPFLSSSNEEVAGMCIVSIKRLLQQQNDSETSNEMVAQLGKMLLKDKITVPLARASVMWLIGEHADAVPKIAPDVLRLGAKNFVGAETVEKLQVLNLGVKLYVMGARKSERLLRYVLSLCRYDVSYDVRDRARFANAILFSEGAPHLKDRAADIFLATKPAPKFVDVAAGRDTHTLGSLSNMMGTEMPGYLPMPSFPDVAPDPKPRQVELQQDFYSSSMSDRVGGFDMFPKQPARGSARSESDFYDSSSSSESGSNSSSSSDDDSRSSDYSDSASESESQSSKSSSSSRSRSPNRQRKHRGRESRSISSERSDSGSRSITKSGSSSESRSPTPPRISRER